MTHSVTSNVKRMALEVVDCTSFVFWFRSQPGLIDKLQMPILKQKTTKSKIQQFICLQTKSKLLVAVWPVWPTVDGQIPGLHLLTATWTHQLSLEANNFIQLHTTSPSVTFCDHEITTTGSKNITYDMQHG